VAEDFGSIEIKAKLFYYWNMVMDFFGSLVYIAQVNCDADAWAIIAFNLLWDWYHVADPLVIILNGNRFDHMFRLEPVEFSFESGE
jgi:hypothetical protein